MFENPRTTLKMSRIVHFGKFLKTKIDGKCQNDRILNERFLVIFKHCVSITYDNRIDRRLEILYHIFRRSWASGSNRHDPVRIANF